jgi:hypothetical protein
VQHFTRPLIPSHANLPDHTNTKVTMRLDVKVQNSVPTVCLMNRPLLPRLVPSKARLTDISLFSANSLLAPSESRASTSTPQNHGSLPPSTPVMSTYGPSRPRPLSKPSSSLMFPFVPAASSPERTGLYVGPTTSSYESTITIHLRKSPRSRHILTISDRSRFTLRSHSF